MDVTPWSRPLNELSMGNVDHIARNPETTERLWLYTGRRLPPLKPEPDGDSDYDQRESQLYEVRIMDNDHNTYQEVMAVCMIALGVTEEQAYAIAWEVDHVGSCPVAQATHAVAERIAERIRTIGIEVQVNPIKD
jgi:ATP-dependent Clp protease adapter protein ClpS